MRPELEELRQRTGHHRHVARASLGRRAEAAVADFLFASGFLILARNLRLGTLELDLVAQRGPLVVVVEVRARSPGALVPAFASVTWTKRARLARAADRLWRTRLRQRPDVQRLRIDVASVSFEDGRTRVIYAEGVVVG